MVDDLERIGKLLELPDLEDETKQKINSTIRDMLDRYTQPKPEPKPAGLDPFHQVQDVQKQAAMLLGQNTMHEWLEGAKDERG